MVQDQEEELIHSSSKHSSIPKGFRLGAVTFIQRFGKALNPHFYFHSCVIDGVFDKEGKFYIVDTLSIDEIQSVQERIRKWGQFNIESTETTRFTQPNACIGGPMSASFNTI